MSNTLTSLILMIYSFLSLDDVSDGNQYLCITEMDVNTDQVEMRFYAK